MTPRSDNTFRGVEEFTSEDAMGIAQRLGCQLADEGVPPSIMLVAFLAAAIGVVEACEGTPIQPPPSLVSLAQALRPVVASGLRAIDEISAEKAIKH